MGYLGVPEPPHTRHSPRAVPRGRPPRAHDERHAADGCCDGRCVGDTVRALGDAQSPSASGEGRRLGAYGVRAFTT